MKTSVVAALLALLAAPVAYAQPASGECSREESRNPFSAIGGAIRDAFRRSPEPCKVDASRALPDMVDTLVIGAGPGGGTTAGRLVEGGQTVVLLDAGDLSQTQVPIADALSTFAGSAEYRARALAYGVERIPESGFIANYPRLAGMGGSAAGAAGIMAPFTWSSVGAMEAMMQDPTLSPKVIHDYQKQIENALWDKKGRAAEFFLGRAGRLHGHSGFQKTDHPSAKSILSVLPDARQLAPFYKALLGSEFDRTDTKSIISAALDGGDLTNPDVQKREGIVRLPQATDENGRRSTVAQYIEATHCKHKDRFYLKGNAVADKIIWEKQPDGTMKAVGVEYLEGKNLLSNALANDPNAPQPTRHIVRAKNVVVANSPFGATGTLIRSGVGAKAETDAIGVDNVLNLPGVGKRVGDRLESTIVLEFPKEFKVLGDLEKAEAELKRLSDRLDANPNDEAAKRAVKDLFEKQKGLLTTNGIPLAMQWKSDPSLKEPDLLFFGFPGNFTNFKRGFSEDFTNKKNLFSIIMLKIETASDGSATVTTADPTKAPKVSVAYDPKGPDMAAMANGIVRFNKEIAAKIPNVKVVRGAASTQAEALEFLSQSDNVFGHHIRGGAAMGPANDPLAVVDSNQKIYGTSNVYVAGTAAWNGSLGPFPIVPIEAMSARLGDKILEANRPR